ncbi:hypothetical protein MSAN_00649900 [Mycena sanguinolenta]|uniref:Uncharacterized protein n=1 Tax=Mycena sanguinolenta TaxID=230812 RepID=A0A8H6Z3U2_9AGAR|nr:hypothetical protein MSAN_00649900 [Mycena sanguinolenta]
MKPFNLSSLKKTLQQFSYPGEALQSLSTNTSILNTATGTCVPQVDLDGGPCSLVWRDGENLPPDVEWSDFGDELIPRLNPALERAMASLPVGGLPQDGPHNDLTLPANGSFLSQSQAPRRRQDELPTTASGKLMTKGLSRISKVLPQLRDDLMCSSTSTTSCTVAHVGPARPDTRKSHVQQMHIAGE